METFGFPTVFRIVEKCINKHLCRSKADLFEKLFYDFCIDTGSVFDLSLINRYINGRRALNPDLVKYYMEENHKQKMIMTIEKQIIPLMSEWPNVIQEIYQLLQNTTVLLHMRVDIKNLYPCKGENDAAKILAEALCYAIYMPHKKPDDRLMVKSGAEHQSRNVINYITTNAPPPPCKWFVGRNEELCSLHDLLLENDKVFLQGIPGIGKSEVAKQYAKYYKDQYTNILYINYSGSLKRDISEMCFLSDFPTDSEEDRFKNHCRFLKSLYSDSLLIIDNFNAPMDHDILQEEILQWRCKILCTTRCVYEEQFQFAIAELSCDDLLALVACFNKDIDNMREVIVNIIHLLHDHTMAVELAARLVAKNLWKPNELLSKLRTIKFFRDISDKINRKKDGTYEKRTYYDHIRTLFALFKLPQRQRRIMQCMTIMPSKGVSVQSVATWMRLPETNSINELIEMGLIHSEDDLGIYLHSIIRDIAVEDLKPSVRQCATVLDSLQTISRQHGKDFINNKQVFCVAENIIEILRKDDQSRYYAFLTAVYEYMEKYSYESGMQKILAELSTFLSNKTLVCGTEGAIMLDHYAAYSKDPEAQIDWLKQAIQMLGKVNAKNAHLASNLYANLARAYVQTGKMDLAKEHAEYGLRLLQSYNLMGFHDTIPQIHNYAHILSTLGEHHYAYSILTELAKEIHINNSDQCLDYGLIQQALGELSIDRKDSLGASEHFLKAIKIYTLQYENEPEVLKQKLSEISSSLGFVKQQNK